MIKDTNYNEESNTVDVSDDSDAPIPVVNLRSTSVNHIKYIISEENFETTITEQSDYYLCMSIFTTNQLQVNFPMRLLVGV